MGLELFSRYKPVNDEQVHRAVMLSCMAMDNVPGAQYFLYRNKLIVAYNWDTEANGRITENPTFQKGMSILLEYLPESYNGKFTVWDSKHKREVPEKILEKTGYVSLYHKEYNKF